MTQICFFRGVTKLHKEKHISYLYILFLCYYKRYHTLHLALVEVDIKLWIKVFMLSWCDNIAIRDFLHFKLSPSLWIMLVVDERRGARQFIYP